MDALKECNAALLESKEENENKMRQMEKEKEEKDQIILSLKQQLNPLQKQLSQIKSFYEESTQKMEGEKIKCDKMMNELDWWKKEAIKLEKECDLRVNEVHKLKAQMDGIGNNKEKQINIGVWKRQFYISLWHRFAAHELSQYRVDQMRDD